MNRRVRISLAVALAIMIVLYVVGLIDYALNHAYIEGLLQAGIPLGAKESVANAFGNGHIEAFLLTIGAGVVTGLRLYWWLGPSRR
jgi:hypothetical protein